MRRIGSLIIVIYMFVAAINAYSLDKIINIFSELDSSEIGLLDTLTLTVTLDTENITKSLKPKLPDMEYFTVLNSSSQSQTSISIVNGKTTRTKTVTYNYILKPQIKGKFVIDPITVEYKGQLFKTDPIEVTVVEGYSKENFDQYMSDEKIYVDLEKLKNDIFILVAPEKSQIYRGEQIFLTYTLYTRVNIDNISLKQSPDFSSFYKEDIYNATRLDYKKKSYNGKIYNASIIKKAVIFPLKPGNYSLKPLILEATVILKDNDSFGFFGRPYTFNIKSNEIKIIVKPIPNNNTEYSFSHIVGDLSISLSKRENYINIGESTVVYLTLKSNGNLNNFENPGINLSKKGRVYLSDTRMDKIEEDNEVKFIKKFEYTVIPEESGDLEIKAGNILYYDTEIDNYKLKAVSPIKLKVTGKNIVEDEKTIRKESPFTKRGLNYIKGNVKTLMNARKSPIEGLTYYFYHILLSLATCILFFLKVKRENLDTNDNLLRKKKAVQTSMEIIKRSSLMFNNNQYPEALDLIFKSLTTYIAYKSEKEPGEITSKTIGTILDKYFNIDNVLKEDVKNLLNECAMLKYSSKNITDIESIKILHEKAAKAIKELELSNR